METAPHPTVSTTQAANVLKIGPTAAFLAGRTVHAAAAQWHSSLKPQQVLPPPPPSHSAGQMATVPHPAVSTTQAHVAGDHSVSKHDRALNRGPPFNHHHHHLSNMSTFGLPASAYELNSNARLTIRFDREMFNSSLFDSEIEISPASIGNNMAFRFNRSDLFRPPPFDFSNRNNTLLNGHFPAPKLSPMGENLETKKPMPDFGLKKTEVKTKPFKCDVCKKSFSSSGGLTVHYRTHTGNKPFKCELCCKTFSNSSHYNYHMRVHSGDKPFKCHPCNKEYSCANGILYHQRTHHFTQDTKPLKCDVCDKLFSSIGGLTVHYRSHTGDRPFKCDVCFKTFTSSSHCKYHQKSHSQLNTKKTLKCDVCNKLFSSSGGLVVHYRMHTGDRPFKCEICFKSFTSSSHFKYHQKSHVVSNEKKTLKCDVCDKLFSSTGGLVVHYRTHTGHRPFKCEICFKSFTSSSHFKYHQKTHM